MPNKEYIQNVANKLIRKFDTRDPFQLCEAIGVEVFYADLGSLKGMYKYFKRNRFAVINEKLDSYTKSLVCAHELGHDILHQSLAKRVCLQEFMLYDMKSRPEYEANPSSGSMSSGSSLLQMSIALLHLLLNRQPLGYCDG
jgi:Zn-dependent peptidase ImmA (M78 family)